MDLLAARAVLRSDYDHSQADDSAESFVRKWAEHTGLDDRPMHGVALRRKYDDMFETETRGRIEYWIDGKRWRMDVSPWSGGSKTKKGAGGRDYKIKKSGFERWVRTDEEVVQMSDDAVDGPVVNRLDLRSANVGELKFDPLSWLSRIIAGSAADPSHPLSHVYPIWRSYSGGERLDMRRIPTPEQTLSAWSWTLGKQHSPTGNQGKIHLIAVPAQEDGQRICASIEFLLKGNDYSPIAVRIVDPSDNGQTVLCFRQKETLRLGEPSPFDETSFTKWPPAIE